MFKYVLKTKKRYGTSSVVLNADFLYTFPIKIFLTKHPVNRPSFNIRPSFDIYIIMCLSAWAATKPLW